MTMITARQLREYVASRGFRAEPLTNSVAAAEGAPLKVMAYELCGPRCNRTIVMADREDLYSLEEAKLWCDGVDYATAKIYARDARKSR